MRDSTLYREANRLLHNKGSRIKSVSAAPKPVDGKEGDMQLHNGHLYIKDKYIWHHFVPKSEFKINKLIDETGGTVVNIIPDAVTTTSGASPTTASFEKAVASLAAKINRIIELLQLDIK